MRFKLDENVPRNALDLLANEGHSADSAVDERLGGEPDERILDVCLQEDRVLITLDLDFADIRLYPPSAHRGIWVLRPRTQSIEDVLSVIRGALATLDTEPAEARLWIVEEGRIRIRDR